MEKKIRVVVADDSAFMRKIITDLIQSDASIEVVGTAKNGEEVITLAKQLRPNVVTLDVEMPGMDGLTALKQLTKLSAVSVIMLSSLTQNGAVTTVKALELGAFDFVAKPSSLFSKDFTHIQRELIEKIREASKERSKVPVETTLRTKTNVVVPTIKAETKPAQKIIAIGTSTGGPRALQTILTSLPASIPAGIVIVQHMPPGFTKSLAARLNELCQIKVVEAQHEQVIHEGVAYIAPGDWHLSVNHTTQGLVTNLDQNEKRKNHRPSVDVLFESVARIPKKDKYYCLLTGMGNDGAEGMKSAKQLGSAITIAEDESTCVVYGMPKSAVSLNCVDHILPLTDIADKLIQIV